jgi:hypothetical protein
MEVTYFSEMSVGCQRITRCYIPEGRTLPYVDLTLPTSTFLGLNIYLDRIVLTEEASATQVGTGKYLFDRDVVSVDWP